MIKKALIAGEELPKEDRFDSNCITPGTLTDRLLVCGCIVGALTQL